MKRIYLLLVAMLALFISTNMYAQYDISAIQDLSYDGYAVDADDPNPLITDAAQFSSPYSQNDLGSADGGNLADGVLIDGSTGNFWHSYWGGGNVAGGTHYLQVEMPEGLDPDMLVSFIFTRRAVANDHTIAWSVRGTDEFDAAKEDCEEIAYVETPFGSNTETLMSKPFKVGAYTYLRFYSEEQQGSGYGTRGYFHLAEFNIYPVKKLDEAEAAFRDLQGIYDQYQVYQDRFDGRLGENPGDYSEECFDNFMLALEAYYDMDPEVNTADEIKAVADDIVATYKALEASKVPFQNKDLPDGYYRIRTAMVYSNGDMYMMGARKDGKLWGAWGAPDLDNEEDNIKALWKITAASDSTYDIQNMYHDGRFMKVAQSTNVEMTDDEAYKDSVVAIEAVYTDQWTELTFVNIRLNSQPANAYVYLHQNNHGSGSGTGAILVGWSRTFDNTALTPGASEWYFEPVDEDEALEIIGLYNKDEDVMKAALKVMMDKAPGMIEIAKDIQVVVEEDKPVVSDENPITSPCSDSAEGQHIEYLWDGKTDNFWHTDWHGEFTAEDHHYLQIEIPDDLTSAAFRFTRRNTDNNHITKWSVYGADEDDFGLVQADLEKLAEFNTPYSSRTETLTSGVFETNGHKYIRFYCEATSNSGNSKFFHAAEFQLYPGHIFQSETCQYNVMGDIAKNLEDLIAELQGEDGYDYEAFQAEDYERMKAAFDAFEAIFVDPSALRDTIKLAEAKMETVVEGTDPGFYPIGTASALSQTISQAKDYDAAGAYTPAQSEEFNTNLNAQMKSIDATPNAVKTGKWYRLRFGTEEEYAKYNWSATGNGPNYWVDNSDPEYPDTLGMYNAGIFGKYIAVAKRQNEVLGLNDNQEEVNGSIIVPLAKEDVFAGQSIHGIDLAELEDQDMALFRFVNIGDSAYAIQNKATGLFISNGGSLDVQPGLFTQHPSGYGQNAFFNKTILGTDKAPLHLAQSQSVLCAWGNNSGSGWTDADGRRGSFFVEEVADVAPDYAFGDFQMSLIPGDIYGRCFPVSVTLKNDDEVELWTINNIERTDNPEDEEAESVKVTFSPISAAEPIIAGRPFFIVAKGEMPEEEEEYDPVIGKFNFTFDLMTTPQTSGYLKGVFEDTTIAEKFLTTGTGKGENSLTWMNAKSTVSANRVYITDIAEGAEAFKRKATLEITFNEDIQDGIATALQNISRKGGIYTIDGRLVGNGNMNDLKNMPKGAYILNGTKVIVK